MKKFLKWVGILLGLLILLAILIFISLVTFVNPNRFKPLIAEKIQIATGRKIIMDGDLSWTVFPTLGLKTGHFTLKNPAGFDQDIFAEVKDAIVSVKLLPLLKKEIKSDGITLDGLKLHLVKNAKGQVNWSFATADTNKSATVKQATLNNNSAIPSIAILGLTINNSEITWKDEQQKKNISLDKLNFHAKNISLLKPFSVSTTFVLIDDSKSIKSSLQLSADVSLNLAMKIFSFRKVELKGQLQKDKKTYHLNVTTDVLADLNKENLQCENINVKSDQLVLKGKINIANLLTTPTISGQMQLLPVDLREWLKNIGFDVTFLQSMENVHGNFDFIPIKNAMTMQGKLSIANLKANNILFSSVQLPLKYQNNVLSINDFDASFYKGKLGGNIMADFNSAPTKFDLALIVNHFDVHALMQDLSPNQKLSLAGDGNLELHIATLGKDKNTLLNHLNGNGKISVINGELRGIDINYMISTVTAMVRKQDLSSTNANKTLFNDLKASFAIQNGVINNNDLQMISTEFNTQGQGTIDLVNQRINYHLQTLLTQTNLANKKQVLNLYGLPIPVLISGDLKKPTIGLDQETLTKALASQQVQKVRSQLQEKIEKGKIPEKAGKFLQQILGH